MKIEEDDPSVGEKSERGAGGAIDEGESRTNVTEQDKKPLPRLPKSFSRSGELTIRNSSFAANPKKGRPLSPPPKKPRTPHPFERQPVWEQRSTQLIQGNKVFLFSFFYFFCGYFLV